MGTWGAAPFDNDDALDLLADLQEADDDEVVDVLRDALAQVDQTPAGTALEAPEVSEAVAAACLIAARSSTSVQPEETSASDFLDEHPFDVDRELRAAASRVLDRALEREGNEWFELWEDADALEEVAAALAPYRSALRG